MNALPRVKILFQQPLVPECKQPGLNPSVDLSEDRLCLCTSTLETSSEKH